MDSKEEWRGIPGWEEYYEASSAGQIRSVDRLIVTASNARAFYRGRILRSSLNGASYPTVTLCREGNKSRHMVHRLVCATFHGPPNPGAVEVDHRNGNRTDNAATNLRWVSQQENHEARLERGAVSRGAKHSEAMRRYWARRKSLAD